MPNYAILSMFIFPRGEALKWQNIPQTKQKFAQNPHFSWKTVDFALGETRCVMYRVYNQFKFITCFVCCSHEVCNYFFYKN